MYVHAGITLQTLLNNAGASETSIRKLNGFGSSKYINGFGSSVEGSMAWKAKECGFDFQMRPVAFF